MQGGQIAANISGDMKFGALGDGGSRQQTQLILQRGHIIH